MDNTLTTTDFEEMSDWFATREPWGEDEFFHIEENENGDDD